MKPYSSYGEWPATQRMQSDRLVRNSSAGNGKFNEEGKRIALDVKEGDTVLFGKYSGSEIKIESKEYLILREDDVFGVVE
jgi:co-chaperonin GroES (HSP10)